jgi:hypothetical protein
MGRLSRAWAHFERAPASAREAGDPCLLAFAAGEQGYVLLNLHRPADLATTLRTFDRAADALPLHERSQQIRSRKS